MLVYWVQKIMMLVVTKFASSDAVLELSAGILKIFFLFA